MQKKIIKNTVALLLSLGLFAIPAFSHGSGSVHVKEMYSVLPFAATQYGTATPENRPVTDWLSLITSSLIDNYKGDPDPAFDGLCFYDYLKRDFGFACKHRLLFHWGFNARPWSDFLEAKISKYPWYSNPSEVERFKSVLVAEQKRRNGLANAATEKVFGFASGGKEAAWANGIIAVMYDVHLLGDYVADDNRDFDGVTPPSVVLGDIIRAVRRIDYDTSAGIVGKLSAASKKATDEHDRASALISCLQREFPAFLLQAGGGSLKRRFAASGYTFKSLRLSYSVSSGQSRYILQICTGGWNNSNYSTSQILDRLASVTEMIPVEKVIIGWNLNPGLYRDVGRYLHSKGIEMIFWMPVFSETGHLEPALESVDLWGMKPAPYNLQEGEDFTFYCPSSQQNIQAVKNIYSRHFAACGFDGVFLDKIRTASYIAGDGGVLSCGCEHCKAIYRRRGFDSDEFARNLKDAKNVDDPQLQRFFRLKSEIITGSVSELASWFHGQGLSVGLDLFAPELAMTVGQDYGALSSVADFIKPMMYRKTDAPAGIGFEMRAIDPGFSDASLTAEYLEKELARAASMSNCPVYPGIEVNYREDIARTSEEYVLESMQAVRQAGLPGAVLAWDIMLAPDSHIRAAAQTL